MDCTPIKQQSSSITFKTHKLALDQSRLGLSGRIFCVRHVSEVCFTKSFCGGMSTNLSYLLCITWGELLWGAVFIIQTPDRMQYFTILKYKLQSFNIQDDRTTRELIAKPLKKIQNQRYGQPVASFGVFEWTLIELRINIIKNLSGLFFI